MKVHRLADVQRGEDCEDVGLDRGDQQLDHAHEHDEGDRKDGDSDAACAVAVDRLHHEVAEHVEKDVTGEHRDEGPEAEADGRTRKLINSIGAMKILKTNGASLGTNSDRK